MRTHLAFLSAMALLASVVRAPGDVVPNPLFTDHAVLQQGMKVPVWGTADPGERVTVEVAGRSVSTTAAANGGWRVELPPLKAGGPHLMMISGRNRITLSDIYIGEVWVCSGQSNMERQLGPRAGQPPITDWEKEAAAARHSQLRHFSVTPTRALAPVRTVRGKWAVCSPETVRDFTAVGYFFGRDLHQARGVPIGLINSSWGGTPAEAWTSEAGLRALPDFGRELEAVKRLAVDPDGVRREIEARFEAWYREKDPGSASSPAWSDVDVDTGSWRAMKLPVAWESAGYADFDGVFWFRRTVMLPEDAAGAGLELHLGAIDDADTTWVNGVRVGATSGWDTPRTYNVPPSLMKPGTNVIAVRVLDTAAGGGLWGGDDLMRLVIRRADRTNWISLAGPWQCRQGVSLTTAGWPPRDYSQSPEASTVLYNGMIAPLQPYAIRGVIWYQGEANVGRERQYRALFPAMIADWRRGWGEGDFPFLFVQIAPYRSMTPEIREAQLLTWQRTKNTAMAVTIDCGDADDIHPARKQPVGARLALAARALAYGEKLEYSGPVFESMKVKGGRATLRFTHLGSGLVARDGPLKGFTMAGPDKVFYPAQAEIRGKTVVVTATNVAPAAAVRYGWANVPEGNLFNRAGLPASPFRTDAD